MKSNFKIFLFYAVIIGLAIFTVVSLLGNSGGTKLSYSDVLDYFEKDAVIEFNVTSGNELTMKVVDINDKDTAFDTDGKVSTWSRETKVSYKLRSLDLFYADTKDYVSGDTPNAHITTFDYEPIKTIPVWVSFLPTIIIIIVMIIIWVNISRSMSGKTTKNSFGKAKVKAPTNDKARVTFKDVAGADEEKEELEEIVEFLKAPSKFSSLGARIPHGVLLVGPPGTGKTLLAKAVAGEAGVPFFSISGSDFVEMYVGVGASRVRDLFDTARKAPASIIFIDEIDAVGRHRGAGLGGGHDEREQTLNQLLVEMDGFGSHEGIIVIAATNRPDILDPALLRPGRFDRQITVNYPDIKGREEILKVHSRNKPLENSVDLKEIAKTTAGFTGADLANLLNEAALLAARRKKSLIGMDDIHEAFIKVIAGPKKKSMKIKDSEKLKTAYHEAGHAIMAYCLPTQDPVQQISIIPSGNALGYTLNPPAEDRYSVYKQGLKDEISMLLGGRAAEQIIFKDISGGASNDIQRATRIAKKMVTELGMSDVLGPINYASEQGEVFLGRDFSAGKSFSEDVAAKIDAEVHALVSEAYNSAIATLNEHIDKLHFIADFLVKYEIMDGEQFEAAMSGNVTIEDLDAMKEEKKRRSREENEKKARSNAEERKRASEQMNADNAASGADGDGNDIVDAPADTSDAAEESDATDSAADEDIDRKDEQ